MLSIDEAIQDFRQLENEFEHYMCDTEDKKENLVKYQREWEYYKQLAEWLEELKKYKAINYPKCSECAGCTLWNCDCANIMGNAIDDFVDKLKTKCDGMIKDKWNSNVAPISWAEAYADFKDDIDGIAEQLKAGDDDA